MVLANEFKSILKGYDNRGIHPSPRRCSQRMSSLFDLMACELTKALNLQSGQESSREQTAEQRSCSIVNSFVPQHFDNFWEQRRQNGFSNQRSGPRLGRIRLG